MYPPGRILKAPAKEPTSLTIRPCSKVAKETRITKKESIRVIRSDYASKPGRLDEWILRIYLIWRKADRFIGMLSGDPGVPML